MGGTSFVYLGSVVDLRTFGGIRALRQRKSMEQDTKQARTKIFNALIKNVAK